MASSTIRIGQYNVLQTIGEGSFVAVHSKTGNKVAMKIINRKKIANMDMESRVKREIQYLKLLRHPHIIKLYEVITTPTDIIMVIEYAGRELFDYIVNNGKMEETTARRFFQQIICAVEYCHRHKIVHRDLKPENLLLDPFENVKIADFGLSNLMSDGDFLKTSCGSPNYAAPEVIGGKLYAGPEVDVWSCGVILFVMLCGQLPFDDEYIPHLFKKITEGIFTIPNYLSAGAKQLLTGMLVVDPMKRMTIAEVRQHPWFLPDLPDYLQPLHGLSDVIDTLDPEIITTLEKKMELSYASIVSALNNNDPSHRSVKVAYQLVQDNKNMILHAKQHPHRGVQPYLMASSPPTIPAVPNGSSIRRSSADNNYPDPTGENLSNSLNTVSILASSLPQNSGSYLHAAMVASSPTQKSGTGNGSSKRKVRSKWHFGIRSRNAPLDVMLEIYRALKQLGMEWKAYDPFHLRCKYHYRNGLTVKMELQLYRLDNQVYLMDFKNVATPEDSEALYDSVNGAPVNTSLYPFFDVCGKLITELAVSS